MRQPDDLRSSEYPETDRLRQALVTYSHQPTSAYLRHIYERLAEGRLLVPLPPGSQGSPIGKPLAPRRERLNLYAVLSSGGGLDWVAFTNMDTLNRFAPDAATVSRLPVPSLLSGLLEAVYGGEGVAGLRVDPGTSWEFRIGRPEMKALATGRIPEAATESAPSAAQGHGPVTQEHAPDGISTVTGKMRMLGQQQGPGAEFLQNEFCHAFSLLPQVKRAYFCVAGYADCDARGAALCVVSTTGQDRRVVEFIAEVVRRNLGEESSIDVLFLSEQLEHKVAQLCRPFYTRSANP